MTANRFSLYAMAVAACCAGAYSQSKKEVKKYGILSVTETVTEMDGGKEAAFKFFYESFDKNGNATEKTEFYPDGTVKRKETARYDSGGDKLEEYVIEPAEAKKAKEKKTLFKYDGKGNKIEEQEYDASGKLARRTVFTYEKMGLRSERKEFGGDGRLFSTKKYQYEFR